MEWTNKSAESTSSSEEVTRPILKKAGDVIVHFAPKVKLHLRCIFVSGKEKAQKHKKFSAAESNFLLCVFVPFCGKNSFYEILCYRWSGLYRILFCSLATK